MAYSEPATVIPYAITWEFTYDANGMRTGRTNGTVTYSYLYNGSQLTQMTRDGMVMRFSYGTDGRPLAICYDDVSYYYITNLQGDVVAIVDGSGATVVSYVYDAWGRLISTDDDTDIDLGEINPLRYRGYVYDHETGLYYLQSRYYNPTWGRFLNADALLDTSKLVGLNQFVYCLNNPINYSDYSGQSATTVWISTMWWLALLDGPLPVADFVYVLGAILIGSLAVTSTKDVANTPALAKKKPTKEPQTPPDVEFPKEGPTVAPGEGYEWRGKPPVGGDKGAWVNSSTGEQWHPDLSHPKPKGPHWDYTDIFGIIWSVFEDGRVLIWEG